MRRSNASLFHAHPTSHQDGAILVVDDEPAVCRVTGTMLEHQGFSVLYAESGEQAIQMFDQYNRQISLLVIDIVMPHVSGPQIAQQLRLKRPDLPVLYVSGVVSPKTFSGGPGGWILKKPYTPSILAAKVWEVLSASV
jgi:CheY-like chemotaxis protein